MEITPVDPRDGRHESPPAHDYRVVFWRRPRPPAGLSQDQIGWHETTFDVIGARDVVEVIEWAEAEGRSRGAIYTLWARTSLGRSEVGELVWLAGMDPNGHPDRPNFEHQLPPGVDPIFD